MTVPVVAQDGLSGLGKKERKKLLKATAEKDTFADGQKEAVVKKAKKKKRQPDNSRGGLTSQCGPIVVRLYRAVCIFCHNGHQRRPFTCALSRARAPVRGPVKDQLVQLGQVRGGGGCSMCCYRMSLVIAAH